MWSCTTRPVVTHGSYFNTILSFNKTEESWQPAGQMSERRSGHALEKLEDIGQHCPFWWRQHEQEYQSKEQFSSETVVNQHLSNISVFYPYFWYFLNNCKIFPELRGTPVVWMLGGDWEGLLFIPAQLHSNISQFLLVAPCSDFSVINSL